LVNEAKAEIMVTQNRFPLQKIQKNAPKMPQNLHLKPGNGSLRFVPHVWQLCTAFVELWEAKLS